MSSTPKKKLVLIPYWIAESLKRNPTLTMSAVLSFPTIRKIASLNDLLCMEALQEMGAWLTGQEWMPNSLWEIWSKSVPDDQPETYKFLTGGVWSLAKDACIVSEVKARLFSPESRHPRHEKAYTCYDLSADVLGVVINPGFFVGTPDTKELQLALTRDVLKVLYVYDTQSEVAKTSLFKRYLELLSA